MATTKDMQRPADKRPETHTAVPVSVKLQIAEQNKQLAEHRYNVLVRRGRAWGTGLKDTKHVK